MDYYSISSFLKLLILFYKKGIVALRKSDTIYSMLIKFFDTIYDMI